jgi:protein-disulfide isomerase
VLRRRCIPALVAALAVAACRPQGPVAPAPSADRSDDAAKLPGFDTEDDADKPGSERFRLELGDAPTRGRADAPVTVVMLSDFECPFCQRGWETLLELETRYRGSIRIAYKAFPLDNHSGALVAALFARSAQAQGKFWEFHDRLFSQQGLDPERLMRYAVEAGLDKQSLLSDLETLTHAPEVARDIRQARRLGVHSTPTFFVNGRFISGAQPIEVFEEIVDEELAQAEKWISEGVPASGIYDKAIADGYREVVYTRRRGLDPDGVFVVPVGDSPTLGPATAPVTIVAFGDFECPFCATGFVTLERLRARYGDDVRMVAKHHPLPFHSHAFLAARASLAAHEQGKFWQFHDALYRTEAKFDADTLRAIARRIGLDMKKFEARVKGSQLDGRIEADQSLAAALGVTGTPAYFVNGRPIEGALPELNFRIVVEEELERAAKARKAGVPAAELYDHLVRQPIE